MLRYIAASEAWADVYICNHGSVSKYIRNDIQGISTIRALVESVNW